MDLFFLVTGSMLAGVGVVYVPVRRWAWQDGWDAGFSVGYQAGSHDERVIQGNQDNHAYNRGFIEGYMIRQGEWKVAN